MSTQDDASVPSTETSFSDASASQPATTTADTQAPAQETTGDNPAPSPDAPVDERADLLKIVKDVVEGKSKNPAGEDAAAPDSPVVDPKVAAAQAAAAALEADPTDEELKGLVPRTKARVEKLLIQRNEARTQVEELKPLAAQWRQMDGYLKKHDLAPEDANLLLGVGASLRRGDHQAFLDGVMPYVEHCRIALGITLPPDLSGKVENGELSTEAATELSTTRFKNSRLEYFAKQGKEAAAAATQAEAQTRTAQAVTQSVTSWEQEVRTKDPDYASKASEVQRFAELLVKAEGAPKTPEAAVEMAKRAYAEVNRLLAVGRPAPAATRPQPSGARSVTGARPEPQTFAEAAKLGLERYRARA